MNIIVTGSLGNISKPLTEGLVQKEHSVTVISSKPEKQKDIEALGASAAIGSVEDVNFLTSTFAGADAVYCMTPQNFKNSIQLDANYVQAIEQSAVRRIVHLSSWGAHLSKGTGFIVDKYHSEQAFNKLTGVALTHIRPASFYYNLLMHVDAIKGAGFIVANYGGDDKTVLVSPLDIATAIADEIENPVGNKIRYVASEELTCNEVAAILGEAIGKPMLRWIRITDEQMQCALEVKGLLPFVATKPTELYAAHHSGKLAEDYNKNRPALGQIKLKDFAKDFVAVYNQ